MPKGEMPGVGGGDAKDFAPAGTGKTSGMKATFLERVWAWLHETFPERQIYIRSNGRVQFFTFGPSLQATLAGLTLIFLGWVAFATVNVIFKDRIITAKDHRYQQMQAAYEGRVADLQISYDELNGALVSAEDRFKATADRLQAKQNAIAGFLSRESEVKAELSRKAAPVTAARNIAPAADDGIASDSLGVEAPAVGGPAGYDDGAAAGSLIVMPGPAQPQPRTAKPEKSSLLGSVMKKVAALLPAGLLRGILPARHAAALPAAYAQHPALKSLVAQTERLERIGQSEAFLMARTETALGRGVGNLRKVLRRTGLNPEQYASRIAAEEGMGGPEVPFDEVRIPGIADAGFTRAYLGASAVLSQLNGLSAALRHLPLATPVSETVFDRTSGFGARVDPFTGRYAFHPGIDFGGPWGSAVHATAPGKVVFAGRRGSYGNMVEIDHGFGVHTRYGHLSKITVQRGMRVEKGAAIGRVGSTGRSTGPHVHYEILYDNVVRNPNNFIEAGRHVL
jgi:murein DD-endopeptidase MepM/ murein hydrolase activator NlpD